MTETKKKKKTEHLSGNTSKKHPSAKKKNGAKTVKQSKKSVNTGTKKKTSKNTGKSATNKKTSGAQKKTAMEKGLERQKRLEQTQILGGLTASLPTMQFAALDAPSRRRIPSIHPFLAIGNFFKSYKKTVISLLIIVAVLAIAFTSVFAIFKVDTVIVEGNAHYTNEEIYNMVIGDGFFDNSSIYLSMKYKNKEIKDIPFIESLSVKITSPSSIKITVYEKAMAGFVEYLGRYFYFDKDGTVIESTDVISKGIPQIMGLTYDHIILYDRLPVERDDIFKEILEVTQLLEKYEIEVDKIYFDVNYNITLYFGTARVKLGDFDNIDEKIIKLKAILPKLEDKKGVLRLDNYDGTDSMITFELD